LLVRQTSAAITKLTGADYRATTDDPYFLYRFWWRRPYRMLIFIESLDGNSLDPRLYVDRGNGFDESTAHYFPNADAGVYSIAISPPRKVRKIRFDPCSREGCFRYRVAFAWTERDIAEMDSAREAWAPAGSVYETTVSGKRERRTKRFGRKQIAEHYASVIRLAEQHAPPVEAALLADGPFISFIVPVYNTRQRYLTDLLASFRMQPAGTAELLLCDDGSTSAETRAWLSEHEKIDHVRVFRSQENRGIATTTNAGLALARGQWIGFIDHDDALSPHIVQLIADTAHKVPSCKFIYTDEVITDEALRPVDYFMKPAFDEVLLSGVNYINHLSCYRRDRLMELGGLREGYDGSQDYDLVLRYIEGLRADEIRHLPFPGYRWRRSKRTYSVQFLNEATAKAREALAEHFQLAGARPSVEPALTSGLHRVRFDKIKNDWPLVSVVIPNRNSFPLISRILGDLVNRTDYSNIEIVVVDNGTTDAAVLELYTRYKAGPVPFRAEIEPGPFNFSRQVNRGVALARGDLVLLLNNDVEVLDGAWLREMVSCFDYERTGIVGARLLYPDRTLQHVGVIVGLGGLAGHWFCGHPEKFPGPMARLHVRQSMTAVTGACMLISRACCDAVGKFDEKEFAVAYNDIDFCLRAVKRGFRVVWTPFATLIHHESASRGSDKAGPNRERFMRDQASLRQRHQTDSFQDRAFSPWYSRNRSEPRPVFLERLPEAR